MPSHPRVGTTQTCLCGCQRTFVVPGANPHREYFEKGCASRHTAKTKVAGKPRRIKSGMKPKKGFAFSELP